MPRPWRCSDDADIGRPGRDTLGPHVARSAPFRHGRAGGTQVSPWVGRLTRSWPWRAASTQTRSPRWRTLTSRPRPGCSRRSYRSCCAARAPGGCALSARWRPTPPLTLPRSRPSPPTFATALTRWVWSQSARPCWPCSARRSLSAWPRPLRLPTCAPAPSNDLGRRRWSGRRSMPRSRWPPQPRAPHSWRSAARRWPGRPPGRTWPARSARATPLSRSCNGWWPPSLTARLTVAARRSPRRAASGGSGCPSATPATGARRSPAG